MTSVRWNAYAFALVASYWICGFFFESLIQNYGDPEYAVVRMILAMTSLMLFLAHIIAGALILVFRKKKDPGAT